jgi:hypothetical protein
MLYDKINLAKKQDEYQKTQNSMLIFKIVLMVLQSAPYKSCGKKL